MGYWVDGLRVECNIVLKFINFMERVVKEAYKMIVEEWKRVKRQTSVTEEEWILCKKSVLEMVNRDCRCSIVEKNCKRSAWWDGKIRKIVTEERRSYEIHLQSKKTHRRKRNERLRERLKKRRAC